MILDTENDAEITKPCLSVFLNILLMLTVIHRKA